MERSLWRLGRWSLAAVSTVAVAALVVSTGSGDAARVGENSSSTAVRLKVVDVPALGQSGFTGTLGTAKTGAAGGTQAADFSTDPDGVKPYVTIVAPSGTTSGDVSADAWDAASDPNVLTMRLRPGGPVLLDVPTLHTYARCQPPHQPQVQNFITAPTVAGRPISEGTTSIPVTGPRVGFPGVATGTLSVTMTSVQKITPNIFAEARVEITISGVFRDSGGKEVYNGPLAEIVLGDVHARCEADPTPTPTPTPTTPKPTPTPTPPEPFGQLVVEKEADKTVVRVGKKVRYTLRATNVGKGALEPATFTDDLSDVLNHGSFDGEVLASSGKATFDRPLLTWTGRLAPGETAVVTFEVTARKRGIMRNVVVWPYDDKPKPTPPPKPTPKPKPKPSGKDVTKTRVIPRHVK